MDIDEMDLVELFQMIDTDGSGAIEAPEFIKPLSRWVHEPRHARVFLCMCVHVCVPPPPPTGAPCPVEGWSQALPQLRTRRQHRDLLSAVVPH